MTRAGATEHTMGASAKACERGSLECHGQIVEEFGRQALASGRLSDHAKLRGE
jgi:hypothetical protein